MLSSHSLLTSVFAASEQANRAWQRERGAAIKIQSAVRMHQQRQRFHYLRRCAINVQRAYRGYTGRLRVLSLRIDEASARQQKIFYCHARTIQRVFRGYLCRKYTNDFCAQKAYISRIAQTSESVRQQAVRARQDQEAFLAEQQLHELRKDFNGAISNQHHLLSTAVCAGVLRSPLAPGGTTTVFGSDIEDEIRHIPIPKRSKFLRDLIPPSSPKKEENSNSARNNNNNNNNNNNKFAASAGAASNKSSTSSGQKSKSSRLSTGVGGARVTNFSVAHQQYQRSLQGQAEYEKADRDIDRKVEQQVVTSLHGKHGSYFHAPKNTHRAPPVVTGYVTRN